jgi:hypothetical protein
MKRFKIEVTENDIKRGVAWNVDKCPVARAMRRATRNMACYASLSELKVGIKLVNTPTRCQRFMRNFDDGENVKPFSFVIRIPE